jgi:hypothetical protein
MGPRRFGPRGPSSWACRRPYRRSSSVTDNYGQDHFCFVRPAPLHCGQIGRAILVPKLKLARTALPVPPQAWHRSFFALGLGFFRITLLDPSGCLFVDAREHLDLHFPRAMGAERGCTTDTRRKISFTATDVTNWLNGQKMSQRECKIAPEHATAATGAPDGPSINSPRKKRRSPSQHLCCHEISGFDGGPCPHQF